MSTIAGGWGGSILMPSGAFGGSHCRPDGGAERPLTGSKDTALFISICYAHFIAHFNKFKEPLASMVNIVRRIKLPRFGCSLSGNLISQNILGVRLRPFGLRIWSRACGHDLCDSVPVPILNRLLYYGTGMLPCITWSAFLRQLSVLVSCILRPDGWDFTLTKPFF